MPHVPALYTATLALAFAALFVVTLFSLRASRRGLERQVVELAGVRNSLQQLLGARTGEADAVVQTLGRQLAAIDRRVSAIAEAQSELGRQPAGGAYDDAAELARRGLDADELISRCGIPAGEAELLVRLQRATPDRYTN